MGDVVERIRFSVIELRRANKVPVTRCYLGHAEYAELREMAGQALWVVGNKSDVYGCEVYGCKVYEVDEPTHFHVC